MSLGYKETVLTGSPMKNPSHDSSDLSPEIKAALTLLVSSCLRNNQQLLTVLGFNDIQESIAGNAEEPVSLVMCVSISRKKALRLYEDISHLVKF